MRCLPLLVAVTLIVIGDVTAQLGPGDECDEQGQCADGLTCYSSRCRFLYGHDCEVQEYESCEWGAQCELIEGEDTPKCRMMPGFPCNGYGMERPCARALDYIYECEDGVCKGTLGTLCEEGVQCVNNGKCERGLCVLRIGQWPCAHDHLCEDRADCIEGTCEPRYGQWCGENSDCNQPSTCIRNRCLLPHGARCRSDMECQRRCHNHYCGIPLGEECNEYGPGRCNGVYVCRGGICTYPPGRRPCHEDLPCVDGAMCSYLTGWCTFVYDQACSAEGRCEANTTCDDGKCKISPERDCMQTRDPLVLNQCVSGTDCTSLSLKIIVVDGQNVAVPVYLCNRIANAECVENHECISERCIRGRCAIDVNEECPQNGFDCPDNMVCQDGVCKILRGQLCDGMIDDQCMEGTVCREWCAALDGQPCVHHQECISGECIDLYCAVRPGDLCSQDKDLCPSNTQCGLVCEQGSCVLYCLTPVGQICSESHRCVSGASCTWNGRNRGYQCTKRHGQPCSQDEECDPHTRCTDGECRVSFCGYCRPGSACRYYTPHCDIYIDVPEGVEVEEPTTPTPPPI